MKTFFFVFFISLSAQALELRVQYDEKNILFESHLPADLNLNLGKITKNLFLRFQVPHDGGDYGMKSIFSYENKLDIISDSEMKAYGWCFSIDGEVPETMADQTYIDHQNSVVVWYYAYAHYKNGKWISQCTPL